MGSPKPVRVCPKNLPLKAGKVVLDLRTRQVKICDRLIELQQPPR
ncbi:MULTISPECIES: hypothetical protein [Cyanophyceae]|nr:MULTISPECIES: hypothetical protein [Cyanophyceae]MDB9358041.1 hypothetical protein [Nodularia spumigena CS-587/03]MDB9316486.1 hypothetical protein [Nodularia spumigena CS-590/01A]MDB9322217.1 hypothetical protein [Nodularia spumigena CS-591/07A]MDB9324846.1 hypothetical protein [Nodularia spumigena CS-590/02]MDB9329135.1 hypothetical protein [Nodularia spumigena CS-591/04]